MTFSPDVLLEHIYHVFRSYRISLMTQQNLIYKIITLLPYNYIRLVSFESYPLHSSLKGHIIIHIESLTTDDVNFPLHSECHTTFL